MLEIIVDALRNFRQTLLNSRPPTEMSLQPLSTFILIALRSPKCRPGAYHSKCLDMDQLYWDIFGSDPDIRNGALSDQSASSIDYNQCRGSETRCRSCRLRLLFHTIRLEDGPQPSKSSALEIVSSGSQPIQAQCGSTLLVHFTKVRVSLAMQEFQDQKFLLFYHKDEDRLQDDAQSANSLESESLGLAESYTLPTETFGRKLPTLYDTEDAEIEDTEIEDISADLCLADEIGYPIFTSPALELVWQTINRQWEPGWPGPSISLREAALAVYGLSYRRGTAHAVGVWPSCDDSPFWLRLWYWVQRQRENLCRIGLGIGHAGR